MKIKLDIADKDRDAVVVILHSLLADEYVLYTKTRNFHWNVTGPDFHELHKFFESQYQELDEVVDETAERVRALGRRSTGSMAEFLDHARLKERPGTAAPKAAEMVEELLDDHEAVVRRLRKDLEDCAKHGDMGTSDFLTGLMERHEKMAWMLRVQLEK